MKQVIENNLNVSKEVRGVIINGDEKIVEPSSGWGSDIRVQVDNASGNIDYVQRKESLEDKQFSKLYLQFLEK